MAQMIAAVTRSRKVAEATSDKDDPTPMYLLSELEKITFETHDAPAHVGDALVKRLGTKSPTVLYKALRVIKNLCLKGHPEFRRFMQRHAGPIRELTTFRGPPDALKGERPNQMVREAAKEASEVVFSSVTMQGASSSNRTAPSSGSGRIQGFGSDQSGGGMGGGGGGGSGSGGGYISSSGSKYTGFGNPNMKQPDPKASESSFSSYLNPQARPIWANAAHTSCPAWMETAQGAANVASQLMTGYKAAPQSRATPFLGNTSDNYKAPSLGPPPAPTAPHNWPQGTGSAPRAASSAASQAAPVSVSLPLSPEARLVESMCSAGAVRVQPRLEDLQHFVTSVSSMDGELVARQLVAQVEAGAWQAALRALFAMEAVAEKGKGESCQALVAWIKQDPGPIKHACSSPQASVAKRADIVVSLLGISRSATPSTGAATAPSGSSTPAVNMMDGDAPPPAEQAHAAVDLLGDLLGSDPAPAVAPAPASAPSDGMFDGLNVGGSGLAPAAQTPDSMFAGLSVGAPAPAAPTTDSMFGGLTLGSGAVGRPEAQPQGAAQALVAQNGSHLPGADGDLADLFTSLNTSEGPAAPPGSRQTPQGMLAQPAEIMPPQPGMGIPPHMQQQAMQMQMHMQQQAMMMGMRPGMPQLMMTPQQQHAMLAMIQQQQGMVHPHGMAMPVPMHQQGMAQSKAATGPPGLAGRAQAPDIFHGNGTNKHASASMPTFPEKHEPAFDFISDHLK